MEIEARSKFVNQTPRKLRLVAAAIRDLPVAEARVLLENLNKIASQALLLVLKQGVGNAVNNFGLEESSLKIKRLEIGEGPRLHRGRPVSRGRWHPIQKKTSHIRMVLEGKEKIKKQEPALRVGGSKRRIRGAKS